MFLANNYSGQFFFLSLSQNKLIVATLFEKKGYIILSTSLIDNFCSSASEKVFLMQIFDCGYFVLTLTLTLKIVILFISAYTR